MFWSEEERKGRRIESENPPPTSAGSQVTIRNRLPLDPPDVTDCPLRTASASSLQELKRRSVSRRFGRSLPSESRVPRSEGREEQKSRLAQLVRSTLFPFHRKHRGDSASCSQNRVESGGFHGWIPFSFLTHLDAASLQFGCLGLGAACYDRGGGWRRSRVNWSLLLLQMCVFSLQDFKNYNYRHIVLVSTVSKFGSSAGLKASPKTKSTKYDFLFYNKITAIFIVAVI